MQHRCVVCGPSMALDKRILDAFDPWVVPTYHGMRARALPVFSFGFGFGPVYP